MIPDVEVIALTLLDLPYEQCNCWQLLRRMYGDGLGLDLAQDQYAAARHMQTAWQRGMESDPLEILRPWDLLVFTLRHAWSDHVGIVLSPTRFLHTTEKTGVTDAPCQRWRRFLYQVGRPRILIESPSAQF